MSGTASKEPVAQDSCIARRYGRKLGIQRRRSHGVVRACASMLEDTNFFHDWRLFVVSFGSASACTHIVHIQVTSHWLFSATCVQQRVWRTKRPYNQDAEWKCTLMQDE